MQEPRSANETPRDRALRISGRLFGLAEDYLDSSSAASADAFALNDPRVAAMLCHEIHARDGVDCTIHRYVVMPNHVHLLIQPSTGGALSTPLHHLKGRSALLANQILGRTGTFWQDESYDHAVRDTDDYARLLDYIDHNPVRAGLCEHPDQWLWSNAGEAAPLLGFPSPE